MTSSALPASILGKRKYLIPKPGQAGPFSHDCVVENTQTMVYVDDVLQRWVTIYLVGVTQTMIPATRRYCADRSEWSMRYNVTNHRT